MVHQKNKEKSVKTVSELDCHAELYGFWIVYKRWVPNGWLKLESASPIKSLPQSWSVMLRHGPPKKQREECENCFGTGLSCWAVGILSCVQEMTNGLLILESASPVKSLPQSWPMMLGPWTPKEHREECENCFGNWTVVQRCIFLNFVQDMGD